MNSDRNYYGAAPLDLIDDLPHSQQHACPYCGIPSDPAPDSLFTRISEQHNRCKICGDVVSNSTESRDAHLAEKGCHV